ncbi:MAG: EAL domain-containing protein [Candidatus Izemoplasmatales bacterium]|jgi:PAS domain S-box-containing protein|nr:EAL domain-containing protein [Candidatus Izemoplasmatales bacterium]
MLKSLKKNLRKFISLISNNFWLLVLAIPILGLINWSYFAVLNSEKEALKVQQQSLASEKVNIIDFIISNAINNTYNDLQVIADSDEMQAYINAKTPETLEDAKQLLYRISNNKPQFASIEVLDLDGDQIVWLLRDEIESLYFVDDGNLINRETEEYFNFSKLLSKDQAYIAPIYLEQDLVNEVVIEKPLTNIIINIYDSSNTKHGTLVLEYNANYLLEIFGQYVSDQSRFIELGIINEMEVWGISPGFYDLVNEYGQTNSDYIEFLNKDDETIIKDNIKLSNFLGENIYNDDFFYRTYAVIDIESVYDEYGGMFVKYPVLIFVINALSFVVIILVSNLLKSKSNDRILLNANMYLSDRNKDGVLITNEKGEITYVNQTFEDIFGYKLKSIQGQKPGRVLGQLNLGIKSILRKSDEIFSKNIWNISKDGIYILKHLRVKAETASGGNIKHFLAIYSDPLIEIDSLVFSSNFESIENFKLLAKAYENEDFKVNKSVFMIVKTFNEKSKKGFDIINNNNIKPISFPVFLSRNLSENYRISVPSENYTIIYFLLDQIDKSYNDVIDYIDYLIDKYKHQPNVNSGLEYNFGIAKADNKTITKTDLIENAFIALQMSKNMKNIKHLVYNESIKQSIIREKDIFTQLEHGFNYDEFYLQYQIQKDVSKNKFTGVEALLRWNSPILGNVSPIEFIKVIENSFFVNQLSLMVLNKVIKDFTPYVKYLTDKFRISINLTSFDFFSDQIIQNLVNIIEKSPIPSKNFCFEITESGYLENKDKTNAIIDYLHTKNITVAIDDFGTGFSSLEVLKKLKIDKIKIDRSFIKDYPEKDDGVMLQTIANLVKTMKFGIILEGAETKEQVDFALENGINEIQGYYVSKPIYIENLVIKYLNKKSDF